jgi:hypothetical protein
MNYKRTQYVAVEQLAFGFQREHVVDQVTKILVSEFPLSSNQEHADSQSSESR